MILFQFQAPWKLKDVSRAIMQETGSYQFGLASIQIIHLLKINDIIVTYLTKE